MNNTKAFKLLSDLGRLLETYGPKAFEELANEISNPDFRERLVVVLKTTAHVHRTLQKSAKKSRSNASQTDFQLTLKEIGGEKAALLSDLYDDLRSRKVLPTLRQMKSFALDNGLPPVKAASRDKALIPFVKTFLKLPIEDVRQSLRRIKSSHSSDDRTLKGWSDIIFGDDIRARRM